MKWLNDLEDLGTKGINKAKRMYALENPSDIDAVGSVAIPIKGTIPGRYAQQYILNTDSISNVGYRNRGDLSYGHENSIAALFHPLKPYTGNEKAKSFIGIRNGKLIVGNKSAFKDGDLMSPTVANTITSVANYTAKRNKDNPDYYTPVVNMFGGGTGSLNVLAGKKPGEGMDKYGGISGGGVLLEANGQTEIAYGSANHVIDAINKFKENTKSDTVKVYSLDNGSYSNALRKDGLVSPEDLRAYDNLNTGGGNFLYARKDNGRKKSFADVIKAGANKYGLKIGELERSREAALDNFVRGTSKTLNSNHLTGNAADISNATLAQMDSLNAYVRSNGFPNATTGKNWDLYDPYHIESGEGSNIADNIKSMQKTYNTAIEKYGKEKADKIFSSYVNIRDGRTNNLSLPLVKRLAYSTASNALGDQIGVEKGRVTDAVSSIVKAVYKDAMANKTPIVNTPMNTIDRVIVPMSNDADYNAITNIDIVKDAIIPTMSNKTNKLVIPERIGNWASQATSLARFINNTDSKPITTTTRNISMTKIPMTDDRGSFEQMFGSDIPKDWKTPTQRGQSGSVTFPQYQDTTGSKPMIPNRTAWSDADTQSINELAGINLTTQERVQIGRMMFGKAYRGTESQNNMLAQDLFRRNKRTPSEPRNIPASIVDTNMIDNAMFGSDNSTQPSPTRGRGRFWFSGNKQPI